MILHLCTDEKFIDYAIEHFEKVAPLKNDFVVVIPTSNYMFKYIKQYKKVRTITNSNKNIKKIISELNKYDAIIFHSLNSFFLKILSFADSNKIKLVWIVWGMEFYNHPNIRKKYIGELTYKTFCFKPLLLEVIKKKIRNILKTEKYFDIVRIIYKISHIIAFKEDNDNIRQEWRCNAKLFWYSYYSIEKTVGSLMDKQIKGNNIFIGNSATMTNNHLEIFQILKNFNLTTKKIIVPLSYGSSTYRDYIVKQGRKLWGENFIPLLNFMEREEYNKYILDCNIVIMNHYRQQAVGNIITSLWLGAKVFMSTRSPVYKYLKSLGIVVYTVENDLNTDNPNVFMPLSSDEINSNRNIIYQKYSLSNVLNETQLLVTELLT